VEIAAPPELEGDAEPPDEFGAFLSDISFTVAELVEAAPWAEPEPEPEPEPAGVATLDRWFLNRERSACGWVGLEERMIEELG
jgi:hypothetical protein